MIDGDDLQASEAQKTANHENQAQFHQICLHINSPSLGGKRKVDKKKQVTEGKSKPCTAVRQVNQRVDNQPSPAPKRPNIGDDMLIAFQWLILREESIMRGAIRKEICGNIDQAFMAKIHTRLVQMESTGLHRFKGRADMTKHMRSLLMGD